MQNWAVLKNSRGFTSLATKCLRGVIFSLYVTWSSWTLSLPRFQVRGQVYFSSLFSYMALIFQWRMLIFKKTNFSAFIIVAVHCQSAAPHRSQCLRSSSSYTTTASALTTCSLCHAWHPWHDSLWLHCTWLHYTAAHYHLLQVMVLNTAEITPGIFRVLMEGRRRKPETFFL